MPVLDAHQHLYPEGVLRALAARHGPPFARWRDGAFTVTPAGEEPFTIDARIHDPQARLEHMRAAGVDRALVALSSAIGAEALDPDQAAPILDAWAQASAALPAGLRAWGAIPLRAGADEQVARADAALDAGAAGICVPTGALTGGRAAVERLGPLLEHLERRSAPLFVHPGAIAAPAPGAGAPRAAWWAPATAYVADLQAAWLAFAADARPAHPQVRVLFAALAGLGPMHAERTAARGGPGEASAADDGIFYDTSSYGPRAIRAMTCAAGRAQIVEGSDHPVLALRAPGAEPPDVATARAANADRLLGRAWDAAG